MPQNKPDSSHSEVLRDRSHMLAAVRSFFAERHVLEVDCPILSFAASVDAHIDLIPAVLSQKTTVYLHSSPEYGMKTLLCEGMGDIYQLSHVFRDEERGPRHHPEFMMIEWYRLGFSFELMIQETAAVCCLLLGPQPLEILSYRDAFLRHLQIDPFSACDASLLEAVDRLSLGYTGIENEGRDAWLNVLLGSEIEPHLGKEGLTALIHYPATQAALAQIKTLEGAVVAERFEIYRHGVELANGYHELGDAEEQELRFYEANQERIKIKKHPLPIDYPFLTALKKGLPECCGVAVGFDRLMMLRHDIEIIDHILPLSLAHHTNEHPNW